MSFYANHPNYTPCLAVGGPLHGRVVNLNREGVYVVPMTRLQDVLSAWGVDRPDDPTLIRELVEHHYIPMKIQLWTSGLKTTGWVHRWEEMREDEAERAAIGLLIANALIEYNALACRL